MTISKRTLDQGWVYRSNLHLKHIDEKAREKKRRVYVDSMNMEKEDDRVNKRSPMVGAQNA